MMYSALEAVERALKLIDSPGRWTTGCNARNPEGKAVPWSSFEARKWDVEGAVRRSAGETQAAVWRDLFWSYRTDEETGKIAKVPGALVLAIAPHRNLFDWNDEAGRTHEDALDLLRQVRYILTARELEAAE